MTICLCSRSCSDFIIFREKYKMRQYSFFSQNNSPNLNLKTMVFHSCTHDSQSAKHGPKFFPTKPKNNLCSMDTNMICSMTWYVVRWHDISWKTRIRYVEEKKINSLIFIFGYIYFIFGISYVYLGFKNYVTTMKCLEIYIKLI